MTFDHPPEGHQACAKLLLTLNPKAIVMEATGVYYLDLALVLDQHQLPISVIDPLSFKRFSQLTLTHTKTEIQSMPHYFSWWQCLQLI